MSIVSSIISIFILFGLYYIFENYDLKTAFIANCIYGIIVSIINNGFNIFYILLSLIVIIVETYILYKIYCKSSSFLNFCVKVLLLVFSISIVLLIISLIISSIIDSTGLFTH